VSVAKENDMRIASALTASLLILFVMSGVATAGSGSDAERARLYYLSIADSLAAGVQPIGDPSDGFRTDQAMPSSFSRRRVPDRPSSCSPSSAARVRRRPP